MFDRVKTVAGLAGLAIGALGLVAAPAMAQEGGITWDNQSEVSFVSTGGNASQSTLGLKGLLTGESGPNRFKVELGGIRSESENRSVTAVGTSTDYTVLEQTESELSAESYFARARYERSLGAAFLFGGTGWDRNTFAGVKNRFASVAGVGATLVEEESGHLKADIGATYTIQKDVSPAPGADEGFGGIRFSVDAARKLSPSATLSSALVVDENIEDTEDLRADWQNSLTVSISEGLALKTSLQLIYDKQPASIAVPLFTTGGNPTGSTVPALGKTLDRVLTLTLVIKL